jgi:hypothetical protein
MSGQVTILQLPTASALTGTEAVPIVQNGVTVQTTTGAVAGAGALNYPFVTIGSTSGLTTARQLLATTGLSLTDSGAGGSVTINMTGAASSLNAASTGIIVKDSASTVINRTLVVGSGMTLSNADGISGNPTFGLSTILQNFASTLSAGMISLNGTTITAYTLQGVSGQISVTNGNGVGGAPTFGLATTTVTAGSYTLPTLTLDAYGRVTAASNAATTGTGNVVLATSPTLTGIPLAPTASNGTATQQLATTQFVQNAISSSGGGSVTSVSVVSANGFAGTVATATSTPAITLTTSITGLLKGNGTAISAATSGTDYAPATSGTSILYGNGSGGFSNVTVGSGLSFSSGTLTSTSSGGSVTSVGWTGGIVSVANPTTTPAFTIAGTSGGVVYFSSGTTWASSAALAANAIVIGGGAGTAPATTTTGTGVLTALGNTTNAASGIVVKDANANISTNQIFEGYSSVVAAGTTTTLTVSSVPNYVVTGSGGQTFQLPDATTLPNGTNFTFNNNQSSGAITVNNNSATLIVSIPVGSFVDVSLLSNATAAGSWDWHFQAPSNTTWSTNTFTTGAAFTSSQTVQGTRLISTIATGTAPLTVASTTQVANLNAATAGTATNANNVALAAGTGATNYLTFSATATGNQPLTTNTLLTYNYTNNALTAGISGGAF